MNVKQMLMLSIMFCLVNGKCSDSDDVTSTVNKILNTTSTNSTSTLVNKLQSTTSTNSISNNSTTNIPVSNKIVTTSNCLCNSASRL